MFQQTAYLALVASTVAAHAKGQSRCGRDLEAVDQRPTAAAHRDHPVPGGDRQLVRARAVVVRGTGGSADHHRCRVGAGLHFEVALNAIHQVVAY